MGWARRLLTTPRMRVLCFLALLVGASSCGDDEPDLADFGGEFTCGNMRCAPSNVCCPGQCGGADFCWSNKSSTCPQATCDLGGTD